MRHHPTRQFGLSSHGSGYFALLRITGPLPGTNLNFASYSTTHFGSSRFGMVLALGKTLVWRTPSATRFNFFFLAFVLGSGLEMTAGGLISFT